MLRLEVSRHLLLPVSALLYCSLVLTVTFFSLFEYTYLFTFTLFLLSFSSQQQTHKIGVDLGSLYFTAHTLSFIIIAIFNFSPFCRLYFRFVIYIQYIVCNKPAFSYSTH